jgi:hypothetical protein
MLSIMPTLGAGSMLFLWACEQRGADRVCQCVSSGRLERVFFVARMQRNKAKNPKKCWDDMSLALASASIATTS